MHVLKWRCVPKQLSPPGAYQKKGEEPVLSGEEIRPESTGFISQFPDLVVVHSCPSRSTAKDVA